MANPAHLTDEQLNRYHARTLGPAELLDVDEHLSACETCRGRISPYTSQMRNLRAELTPHLEYEEIVACAEDSPAPANERHLAECEMCRAEVADLRQFRVELAATPRPAAVRKQWWVPAAIAAAVLIAAGVAFRPARPAKPVALAERPLSQDQRQALDLAMSSHRLERAPILDRVIGQRGELLGPGHERTFELTAPVGTAVLTDRPLFQWKPVAGAAGYVMSIFDENFDKVAESPTLTETSWLPANTLPRGHVYVWQVKAKVGGEIVQAPVPPEPEARFEVVTGKSASEIESARRDHPANHLLLAALCARAGDLDDAGKEIDALAATDPAGAAALRASLASLRGR